MNMPNKQKSLSWDWLSIYKKRIFQEREFWNFEYINLLFWIKAKRNGKNYKYK